MPEAVLLVAESFAAVAVELVELVTRARWFVGLPIVLSPVGFAERERVRALSGV